MGVDADCRKFNYEEDFWVTDLHTVIGFTLLIRLEIDLLLVQSDVLLEIEDGFRCPGA